MLLHFRRGVSFIAVDRKRGSSMTPTRISCARPSRNGSVCTRAFLLSACATLSFTDTAFAQDTATTDPAAAVTTTAPTAQAAERPETATGDAARTEEEIIVEGRRAVTATKTDTPLREIPQSISVISSQQIE